MILGAIHHPVLIVNGSNDSLLFKRLPNALLILYPSLFQYPEFFAPQVELFLNDHQQQRRAA